ncbi:hypothetical protein DFH09DRAFT_1154901 [Mycena vulgaris]|nr:hypothetical protein DFH09DRAFT_1154901 [Mycena vulgaris]
MTFRACSLFQPVNIGPLSLNHRVVLCPLTRLKADANHVPFLPLVKYYYAQRASTPATLNSEDPTFPFVSGSEIPIVEGDEKPRSLTVSEIKEYVGFVEMHNANGCILDQFIQDVSNNCTDAYGSEAKRALFSLEVIKAVAEVVGEDRTAIRFSPWSPLGGMGMTNPIPTFSHIVSEIKRLHPKLAYIHLIEPRISGSESVAPSEDNARQSNGFIRDIWAIKLAERKNALVACGRTFIANPDLPLRLEKNIPLHPYDRSTFYLPGQNVPTGHTDQPFATQQ